MSLIVCVSIVGIVAAQTTYLDAVGNPTTVPSATPPPESTQQPLEGMDVAGQQTPEQENTTMPYLDCAGNPTSTPPTTAPPQAPPATSTVPQEFDAAGNKVQS